MLRSKFNHNFIDDDDDPPHSDPKSRGEESRNCD